MRWTNGRQPVKYCERDPKHRLTKLVGEERLRGRRQPDCSPVREPCSQYADLPELRMRISKVMRIDILSVLQKSGLAPSPFEAEEM